MRRLQSAALLAFATSSACVAQTPSLAAKRLPDLSNLDAVILTPAQFGQVHWLITSTRSHGNVVQLSLVDTSKHAKVLWTHVFNDGYDPVVYPSYRWMHDNRPLLVFTYQLGAAWQKLTVIGIGPHGPSILQQIDGGAFDVVSVTLEDGNGDLRSIDGSLPITHHCFDWSAEGSKFMVRACKTFADDPAAPQ